MSDQQPINLHRSGPPETILPDDDAAVAAAYADALDQPDEQRRDAIATIVAANPTFLAGWASLGDLAGHPIDAYAAYRVGYHRGLDSLRQNGWRGSGYVRWRHVSNRGFLRSLDGLRRCAGVIGETAEEERCALFLRQLDPSWPPDDAA